MTRGDRQKRIRKPSDPGQSHPSENRSRCAMFGSVGPDNNRAAGEAKNKTKDGGTHAESANVLEESGQ